MLASRLFLTFIQCLDRPAMYGRPRCFETRPSRPIWHAARNNSGPISRRSNGFTKDALWSAGEQRFKIGLSQLQGQLAQILAAFARTSKAQNCTSSSCLRECRALKSETPSRQVQRLRHRVQIGLRRIFRASSTIQGYRLVQLYPPRVISRTRSPSRSRRRR